MVKGSKGEGPEEEAQRVQIAVFKGARAGRYLSAMENCCWYLPHYFHRIPGPRFLEMLRLILTGYYLFSLGQFLFTSLFHE